MAGCASKARWLMAGAAVAAAVLVGPAGCKGGSNGPPALPAIAQLPAPKGLDYSAGVNFRQRRGEDIAPVVIADDPPPGALSPGAPGQAAAGRATLNGDPGGITRESLNSSIQGAMGSLAACFTNITHDPMVAVSFEADPSGRPSLVRINGAPPDVETCIRSAVQNIRFPAFQGKSVQVDLPLSFHRVSRPAPPGNPTGEQQAPAGPPLFIE